MPREPSDTQDFISERFRGHKRFKRVAPDRDDLKRVPGGEARDFRKDNPDAGYEDYQRYKLLKRQRGE